MGDGHEFDPVREVFGQLHQHNLMLSRALAAERRAAVMEAALQRLANRDNWREEWHGGGRFEVYDEPGCPYTAHVVAMDALKAALLSARGEA